jgi:peptidoglycan/xylan/chitin deacetylase (PgdA/CDA1 family)
MKITIGLLLLLNLLLMGCKSKEENNNQPSSVTGKPETKKTSKEKLLNPLISIGKKDSAGNEIENGKKKIYLTFDDGPNAGTRAVMDALNEEKIPATFYMIGLHRYGSPLQEKLWNEVNKNPAFEVVNHSFTHAFRNHYAQFYADVNGAVNDFVRNNDSLRFNNTIIRAPGSNVWRLKGTYRDSKFFQRTKVMDSLFQLGYFITGWDNEWEYAGKTQKAKQSPDELISQLNAQFAAQKLNKPNHLVLLAHDMVFADAADGAWLKEFLSKLKSDPQIEFRVISQYPGAGDAFKKHTL